MLRFVVCASALLMVSLVHASSDTPGFDAVARAELKMKKADGVYRYWMGVVKYERVTWTVYQSKTPGQRRAVLRVESADSEPNVYRFEWFGSSTKNPCKTVESYRFLPSSTEAPGVQYAEELDVHVQSVNREACPWVSARAAEKITVKLEHFTLPENRMDRPFGTTGQRKRDGSVLFEGPLELLPIRF